MLPIFGLVIGIVVGLTVNFHVPQEYSSYLAMAILAALDTVFGAMAASMQNNFNLRIFTTGFFGNALIAALLTFVGKMLDVNLGLAAIIVFGTRMFNNFAIIRRMLLNKWTKKSEN